MSNCTTFTLHQCTSISAQYPISLQRSLFTLGWNTLNNGNESSCLVLRMPHISNTLCYSPLDGRNKVSGYKWLTKWHWKVKNLVPWKRPQRQIVDMGVFLSNFVWSSDGHKSRLKQWMGDRQRNRRKTQFHIQPSKQSKSFRVVNFSHKIDFPPAAWEITGFIP